MSGAATSSMISVQLQQILKKINDRLLSSLAAPQSVAQHEMAGNPLVRELSSWQKQIELFQKRLGQIDSGLHGRAQAVHSLPRDQRFRERQSIGSGRDSLAEAQALAATTRERLMQLIRRTLVPGGVEAVNKGTGLVDDALKEFAELEKLVEQSARSGGLSQQELQTIQTVLRESGPQIQSHKVQPGGADWLLLVTVMLRVTQIVLLKVVSKCNDQA
jgi:hypothetical protein